MSASTRSAKPAHRSSGPTAALAEGFRAGESLDTLADLYDLDVGQVRPAIRFEMRNEQSRTAA